MQEKISLQKEMFLKNCLNFLAINLTCGIVKKDCRLLGILLKLTFDDYDDEKFDVIFFLYWKKLHYLYYYIIVITIPITLLFAKKWEIIPLSSFCLVIICPQIRFRFPIVRFFFRTQ